MRIIVVEDSKLHQKVVKKIIHFVFPYAEVICCGDAYDAWALLKASPKVDLMILDHNMPYAKGGDFIGKVRSDHVFKELSIIMLTGEDKGEEFLKAGANAFFGKPFDPNHFKEVVKNLGLQ
jgi:CheY-like chemotaxis protein